MAAREAGGARRLDLKVGFSCNNRCVFCVQGERRSRERDRNTPELKELLASARPDCDAVVLTGGEASIRPDVVELVAEARRLGYVRVQLQTNGRMLSHGPFVQRLLEAGLSEVSPSVHGPGPELHDRLTRAPGAFAQALRGIVNCRALGLPILLNSVVVRANLRALPEMARLFARLHVDQFQLAFPHPLGSAAQDFDAVVPGLAEAMPWILQALRVGREAGIPCMTEGVPLCFLPGYEEHAAERIIPRTRILDVGRSVEDWTQERRAAGKAHGPPCAGCRLRQCCEGPWREYAERRGWGEFVPARG